MENRQPLFPIPAAQTISDIGETIFMQTSGDEHEIQQNRQSRGGPAEMRRKHPLQQRPTCANDKADHGEEFDCACKAVGRELHLGYP
jgi:hypothetical protein